MIKLTLSLVFFINLLLLLLMNDWYATVLIHLYYLCCIALLWTHPRKLKIPMTPSLLTGTTMRSKFIQVFLANELPTNISKSITTDHIFQFDFCKKKKKKHPIVAICNVGYNDFHTEFIIVTFIFQNSRPRGNKTRRLVCSLYVYWLHYIHIPSFKDIICKETNYSELLFR